MASAVDGEDVGVDEGALLGICEDRDGLRNVFWFGEASQRDAAFDTQVICEELNWRQPNNPLKERACRDALSSFWCEMGRGGG